MAQAAVQDPDQPVGQGPQGLMVGGATSPVGVVVAASPGEPVKRGERPQVTGGAQPPVPAARARTTCRSPEARVMGAVPA